MISPIPDQIVSQGAQVSLDVDSYFNEMILEYTLLSPEFLSFSQRHLQPVDLTTARAQAEQRFLAVARSHRYIVVLEEGTGLLVYEVLDQFQPQLLQHYFADLISHNYSRIAIQGDLLAVYSQWEIALVDLANKFLPCLVSFTQLPHMLTQVLIRSEGQLVLATEDEGLFLYDYQEETGLTPRQEISVKFGVEGKLHVLDMVEMWDRLFVLDRDKGLLSVHTPWLNTPKEYGIRGSKLAQADFSLVVDGKLVLHLSNDTSTLLQPPLLAATSLVAYKEMVFSSNKTHLSVLNTLLNLTSFEPLAVQALDLYNSNLLVVESGQFRIRNYIPGSTSLSGTAPDTTGEFKIHFKARAKDGEVEASFSVIVESPPLEILLVLLAASTLALLFIVGCSLVLRKVIGLTPRPERHVLNEERGSADQLRAESFGASVGELPPVQPQP